MFKQLSSLAIIALNLLPSVMAEDPAQSLTKPREFAARMLEIYQAKNVEKLLDHSTDGPATPRLLQRMAPDSRRYKSLFGDSSWRWKAVDGWNKKFAAVRYHRTAMVQFTKGSGNAEVGFVRLAMENNKWKFRSIDHMTLRSVMSQMSANFKLPAKTTFAPELNRNAMMILKAHQQNDVALILKNSVAEGPSVLNYIDKEDAAKSKSELLFSKTNMEGITEWDGKFHGIYLSEMARVEFARDDSSVYVVTLVRDGTGWKFEDIHSPDIADFEAMND